MGRTKRKSGRKCDENTYSNDELKMVYLESKEWPMCRREAGGERKRKLEGLEPRTTYHKRRRGVFFTRKDPAKKRNQCGMFGNEDTARIRGRHGALTFPGLGFYQGRNSCNKIKRWVP